MSELFEKEAERDDRRSKVYLHKHISGDKKGRHLWKVGVTNGDPQIRRKDYLRKHPNMVWLKNFVTRWYPINETGDLQDRARFDKSLRSNLASYKVKPKYETNPTEMYRGTDKEIEGTVWDTLVEHRRGSNR